MISDRALGQYPISIATSLALESACGIHPDIPVKSPPILKYDELWINIRTLYRNIIGAVDKSDLLSIRPPLLATTLLNEMEMIEDIINSCTANKVKVIFYYSDYKDLEAKFKLGVARMDNTDAQKEYTVIHNNTIKLLLKEHANDPTHDIRLFDLAIKTEHSIRAMIITNYAIDLLSVKAFSHLSLLESHTGTIREKELWYRKYYNGKDLSQIPFNDVFIRVFGDSESFRPMVIGLRKEILEIASKYNWSSVTTREKLLYGINQMKDFYSKDVLKSMF
jgi:hypothetical protein